MAEKSTPQLLENPETLKFQNQTENSENIGIWSFPDHWFWMPGNAKIGKYPTRKSVLETFFEMGKKIGEMKKG